MSYAALMVHFDARRSGERRVRLAADLAHRFHALLIGIAGRSYLPPFLAEDTVGDAERDDGERREMTQLLADLEKQFRAAAKNAKQVEWRGILDDANNLVPREARAADLVIIGRKQDPRDLITPSIQASPFSAPGVQSWWCPTRSIRFRPGVSSWRGKTLVSAVAPFAMRFRF